MLVLVAIKFEEDLFQNEHFFPPLKGTHVTQND